MFGKRSTSGAVVVQPAWPARVLDTASMKLAPTPAQPIPVAPVTTQTERRPDSYYQTKSMIFGALIGLTMRRGTRDPVCGMKHDAAAD